MARVAPAVPSETDLLCEHCGYTLNGLPTDARCPECGEPVQDSIVDGRKPSPWERSQGLGKVAALVATLLAVLFSPTRFFRSLSVRVGTGSASTFGWLVLVVVAVLFAGTAAVHWTIVSGETANAVLVGGVGLVATLTLLPMLTTFAARLTHWEATYRGLRLPLNVIKKCMAYHYVHYLPVALVILATSTFFELAVRGKVTAVPPVRGGVLYLYVLSGEVVLAAGYLFWTYWIAMRNVMYANR